MSDPRNEPPDPLVKLRADLDQMIASLPELSRAYYAQFVSLCEAGFTDEQSLRLTQTWMKAIMASGPGTDE